MQKKLKEQAYTHQSSRGGGLLPVFDKQNIDPDKKWAVMTGCLEEWHKANRARWGDHLYDKQNISAVTIYNLYAEAINSEARAGKEEAEVVDLLNELTEKIHVWYLEFKYERKLITPEMQEDMGALLEEIQKKEPTCFSIKDRKLLEEF